MTDDLVKRLRADELPEDRQYQREARVTLWGESQEAADRIEALGRHLANTQADFAEQLGKALSFELRMLDAEDRIEELEAALAKVAEGYTTEWSTSSVTNMFDIARILSKRIVIARKALEGKDD